MSAQEGPYVAGAWLVWNPDSSYFQGGVHVFADEIAALRWAQEQKHHGYNVSFVQFGDCPLVCDECGILPDPTATKAGTADLTGGL